MSKTLKLSEFIEMLNTSASIAVERGDAEDTNEVEVQLIDEEGNLYYIQDVKYHAVPGGITIVFDHDE